MQNFDNITAIGLMCDPSLEGIEAAIITTNGLDYLDIGPYIFRPHDEYLVKQISEIRGKDYCDFPMKLKKAEYDLTMAHARAVDDLIIHAGIEKKDIGIIGFHGLTLYHNPKEKITFQLGDASLLANETKLPVVAKFRTNDILNGGYGGPLTPLYLSKLYADIPRPLAILNISGFVTMTIIDENERLTAGVIGPGTGMLNAFMLQAFDIPMDYDGEIAATGTINEEFLNYMLADEYFQKAIPKSIPHAYFQHFFSEMKDMNKNDIIATLTALVAKVIVKHINIFSQVVVSGGGLKNPTLMRMIKTQTDCEILSCKDMGIEPRMIEAQAFGFLAVKNIYNLPASFPETTGVANATICGSLYNPE